MTTRAEFFERIRREVKRTRGLFPATVSERPARPIERAEIIRRELAERWPETLDRFRLEFERVGGALHRAATPDQVPGIVASIARERGFVGLVAWHPSALGADWGRELATHGVATELMPAGEVAETEQRRLRESIAAADLGLTGADLAIAETGTLVLRSGAGRPGSTSLLPPCHVAVFDRTVLVESLAQAGVFLEAWHAEGDVPGRGAVINFITGPSRTADIELTLTRGVHGPREVHGVFVDTLLGG